LYSSPNNIKIIKTKTTRIEGHITHTKEKRGAYKVFLEGGNLRERDHLEDLSVEG